MVNTGFSKAELERYSRHLIIPSFNIAGQRKLKEAKVLVVGTGGLGAPLLQYLTAAGIGTIGLVDYDVVDETNLQRQVLFSVEDIGKSKVRAAEKRLKALNPHIQFNTHEIQLTSENALEIIREYDVVADGTDNFPTRYLVNDACVLLDKPNVYGSIFRFDGQVSVFNYTDPKGLKGPNYRDLFPAPPPPGLVPSCAEGGVLGVLPGIVGSLQASEVIKVVTGIGEPLSGKLFLFDALTFETRTVNIPKDPGREPITGLVDYEAFCGETGAPPETIEKVKEISVKDLASMKTKGEDFQLIDVREPYEFEIAQIGGTLMPLNEIEEHVDKISTDKTVIFHCRTGIRSAKAIKRLEKKFGFTNFYNLNGGILAYADEVDPSLAKY